MPGRETHQASFVTDTGGHHHQIADIAVNRKKGSSLFQITHPLQITASTVIRNMPLSINKTRKRKKEKKKKKRISL